MQVRPGGALSAQLSLHDPGLGPSHPVAVGQVAREVADPLLAVGALVARLHHADDPVAVDVSPVALQAVLDGEEASARLALEAVLGVDFAPVPGEIGVALAAGGARGLSWRVALAAVGFFVVIFGSVSGGKFLFAAGLRALGPYQPREVATGHGAAGA